MIGSTFLAACGLVPFAGGGVGGADDNWPEVFVFELQPGDLVGDELEAEIMRINPMDGDVVPGTARHLAWVDGPGGRTDFFSARFVNVPDDPQGPMFCTMIQSTNSGSAGCGSEPEDLEAAGLRELGAGASGSWQEAEFAVAGDIVRVEGVTDDGTEYSIIPLDGRGWVKWKFDRGFMELTGFDANDEAVDWITVGMRRCEMFGGC